MHDRSLHDDLAEDQSAPNDGELYALIERLREQAEPEVEIAGQRFYVFHPFKGRNGFYDRQVNDDREV